jgi:hypothetical protein
MNHLDHRLIGKGIVATLAAGLALAVAPLGAQAAVGCTQVVTGPHDGVINVAGGQKLCMLVAVQNGAVNVAPGGSLSVSASTITGAVTLTSGFGTLEFCGSTTLRGAISATAGVGPVLIGGSDVLGAILCPANTIDGAVTLTANQAGVTLGRNSVSGAVNATANLGGTMISGNRIGGRLTCASNAPAPVNGGVANAVAGDRSGQTCSSLAF